jgi:hypothetical protein
MTTGRVSSHSTVQFDFGFPSPTGRHGPCWRDEAVCRRRPLESPQEFLTDRRCPFQQNLPGSARPGGTKGRRRNRIRAYCGLYRGARNGHLTATTGSECRRNIQRTIFLTDPYVAYATPRR